MNIHLLASEDFVVFTTRRYAYTAGLSISSATKQLTRRSKGGLITKITRGVWANTQHPFFNALACVPHLLNDEQGYVSFLSALHRHGILSQIPGTIQVATTGHSRTLKTSVGVFEFFQLKPELMQQGVEWSTTHVPYLIASAEKALIDTLYISARRKKRFSKLPELDLNRGLCSTKRLFVLVDKLVLSKQIKSAIKNRLCNLMEGHDECPT